MEDEIFNPFFGEIRYTSQDGVNFDFGALWEGKVDKVSECLARGARVDQRDGSGQTPLILAIKWSRPGWVRFLLSKGANYRVYSPDGIPPICLASMTKNLDSVDALLDAGCHIDLSTKTGVTSLMLAAYDGDLELVDALLFREAGINEYSTDGRTALMYAACKTRENVVKFLVAKGADINIKNKDGETALDLYKNSGGCDPDIVAILFLGQSKKDSGVVTDGWDKCVRWVKSFVRKMD
jgi:uncharacterized protein